MADNAISTLDLREVITGRETDSGHIEWIKKERKMTDQADTLHYAVQNNEAQYQRALMASPPSLLGGPVDQRYPAKPLFEGHVVKIPKLHPQKFNGAGIVDLEEYAAVAEAIGVQPKELLIERFKLFLDKNDWPVYQLAEVVSYMDKKANGESKNQAGWEWKPLRVVDRAQLMEFGDWGKQASHVYEQDYNLNHRQAASDSYKAQGVIYDRLVPLQALKKVAAIEKMFGKMISFLVCDYAPAPKIQVVDPFLCAVVPNAKLGEGVGRFVIDFWDEPGFGLAAQLKK